MRSARIRLRMLLRRMLAFFGDLNPRSRRTCKYCEAEFRGVFSARKLRKHLPKEHFFEVMMEHLHIAVACMVFVSVAHWLKGELALRRGAKAE